jgi:two-component system nitrate/nitrite response regulator NarL
VPTVILVSDQPVLLCGLAHVLESRGFEVAACCAATDLPQRMPAGKWPDLAVLDLTAGLTFGSLTEFHSKMPTCPVVLWADALPLELVFKTLEFGVRGILQRTSLPEQVTDSLRRVCNGEMQIGFGSGRDLAAPKRKVALTPREREIIDHLRQGLRNKQIAGEMNITEGTVKIYLFRLFHKLGVRNRFELARCGVPDHLQFSGPQKGFMVEGVGGAYFSGDN